MSEQIISIGSGSTVGLVGSSPIVDDSTSRNIVPLKTDETVHPENCGSSADRVICNPRDSLSFVLILLIIST